MRSHGTHLQEELHFERYFHTLFTATFEINTAACSFHKKIEFNNLYTNFVFITHLREPVIAEKNRIEIE